MKREILIDSVCGRKRLAVIENGRLCEMHYERLGRESLAGNIYTGRVMNVLSGMNAAFVDIGVDKNAFLQAGDIKLDIRGEKSLAGRLEKLSISDIVRPGQEILVQVVKEPGGTKGPRISNHITLPGKLMVLLPTMRYIGISRKIEDENLRGWLRSYAEKLVSEYGMGLIMRTASADADESAITDEYLELCALWRDIIAKGSVTKAPALIHGGGTLTESAVRDYPESETVLITDDDGIYSDLLSKIGSNRVRLHSGDIPLFDMRGVDCEYEKSLKHHVWLNSGGYLVIDHTEALTVIDVNTGKYVGNRSQEETIFRINSEAACEIARQLRLRDIGGIIIVDFIDMQSQTSRDELLALLRTEMANDRNPSSVVGMTSLGLVELTRKKKRLSAEKILKHVCPACAGEGTVDDFETIAWRIIYDLRRRHLQNPDQAYVVHLSDGVAGALIPLGAPGDMKVHVVSDSDKDDQYRIEPVDASALAGSIKLLRIN